MISGFSYRKAFENWWTYYFLKNLYGYNSDEMKEYSDYKPAPFKIEKEKYSWYIRIKKNAGDESDKLYVREEWDMGA